MTATLSCIRGAPTDARPDPIVAARSWFAVQAVTGATWWIAVLASAEIRVWTLGGWDPRILVVPDLALFVGASAIAARSGGRLAAAVAASWTTAATLALTVYGVVTGSAGWGVVLMSISAFGSLAAAATLWFGHVPTAWFFVGPFSFRVADTASDGHHLRRSLGQLVVFWATFFGLVPLLLVALEVRLRLDLAALDRWDVVAVGATTFVLGSAMGLWACVTMALDGHGTPLPAETARDLVLTGPYRYVRNPMAVAGAVQTVGIGLLIGSWTVIVVAVAGALVWNTLIRPAEEADLRARFGDPYLRYCERVRCWVPVRPADSFRRRSGG